MGRKGRLERIGPRVTEQGRGRKDRQKAESDRARERERKIGRRLRETKQGKEKER